MGLVEPDEVGEATLLPEDHPDVETGAVGGSEVPRGLEPRGGVSGGRFRGFGGSGLPVPGLRLLLDAERLGARAGGDLVLVVAGPAMTAPQAGLVLARGRRRLVASGVLAVLAPGAGVAPQGVQGHVAAVGIQGGLDRHAAALPPHSVGGELPGVDTGWVCLQQGPTDQQSRLRSELLDLIHVCLSFRLSTDATTVSRLFLFILCARAL
jgi:hypothetical protein